MEVKWNQKCVWGVWSKGLGRLVRPIFNTFPKLPAFSSSSSWSTLVTRAIWLPGDPSSVWAFKECLLESASITCALSKSQMWHQLNPAQPSPLCLTQVPEPIYSNRVRNSPETDRWTHAKRHGHRGNKIYINRDIYTGPKLDAQGKVNG